jgi:uncharacterized protein (TIGR04255 family)
MADGAFMLNLNEPFPRLLQPPIVEAVIHLQARAQKPMELDSLRPELAAKLPMYPQSAPIQGFGLMATLSGTDDAPVVEHHNRGFLGMRLTSDDGCYTVQFLRDGLVFSRTKSYQHWEPFASAAKQAWQVFTEIAGPVEIQRLGVRFINHFAAAMPETLRAYLREPPTGPSNLPLKQFVYQSTFAVPGHPYGVRVTKVMQPSTPELQQTSGLFLDIDVFSTKAMPNDPGALDEAFGQMRWLKNKVFFTLLTDSAVRSFS